MRKPITLLSVLLLVATAIGIASPAQAAIRWGYVANAGGTQIQALGTTIKSDLTAQSSIAGVTLPKASNNAAASASVGSLAKVGAVTTDTSADKFGVAGTKVTANANTAQVNLLGGKIRIGAVETKTYAQGDDTDVSGGSDTTFVDLVIAGKKLPISFNRNTKIGIPGLAEIVLNESKTTDTGNTYITEGAALKVTLLRNYGNAHAGAVITLNPTQAGVIIATDFDAPSVGGIAYGSYALLTAGSDIKVFLGPSAATGIPPGGTGNRTTGNSTASANLPKVLNAGLISTTAKSLSITGYADAADTAQIARVNVLNGLIKADAIGVASHIRKTEDGIVSDRQAQFLNVSVGKLKIPLNAAPNTKIDIAGVGTLIINRQIVTAKSSWVVGLDLTLSTAKFGLPVNAEVQLGVAAVWVS